MLFCSRDPHCRQLILESFVPPDEKMKVFDRAYYDEDEEEWKLKPLARPERQVNYVLYFILSINSIRCAFFLAIDAIIKHQY